MSLGVGQSVLTDARKALAQRWDEVRRHWDDEAAQRFEDEFIRPIEDDLRRAVDAMAQAQHAAQRAQRDCS